MKFVIWFIIIYLVLVFIIPVTVIPNLTVWKRPLPKSIPKEIEVAIKKLEKNKNKESFLKAAYKLVTKKYYGTRFHAVLRVDKAFRTNLGKLWKQEGPQHCHIQNYILRVLLEKSKFFKKEDIKLRISSINPFIHQVVYVRINNKWIRVDPWGSKYGIKIGQKVPWFI